MSTQSLGLLIGGIIPAFLFAFGNTFIKAGSGSGISLGMFMLFETVGYLLCIALAFFLQPDTTVNFRSGSFALLAGIFLAGGTVTVMYALQKYGMTNSQLVPLYNMNTLIAVLLALWIFAEWKDVKVIQLLLGSVLIVLGAVLVARA